MVRFIDSRIPVDSGVEPVQISSECSEDLDALKEVTEQLNQLRTEMGRIYQVLGNLRDTANKAERNMIDVRKRILEAHDIDEGQWVVDFTSSTLVKVAKGSPLTP